MADIHVTAVVAPGAQIGADVSIGPYCCIGSQVVIESGVTLRAHVVVDGRTTIGAHTAVYPFASIGLAPQHQGFKGEPSVLTIGHHNVIREHVTINPGTADGTMATRIGDHGFFMVGAHVAHDCRIGDHVIMANNATLGGHVELGDNVVIGGLSAVHQFVRIGRHAMVGGMSGVARDVIPFGMAVGNRARLTGLNLVGLKRRGMARTDIHALRVAYRQIFEGEGPMVERLERVVMTLGDSPPVMGLVDFIRDASPRSLCRPNVRDAA